MRDETLVLYLDPKHRVHSVVYRVDKDTVRPIVSSIYLLKDSLLATFGDFPKEITLTVSAK